jgi:hypothetical protein
MWRRLIFDRGGFDEDADPSSDTGYTHTGFVDALDRHVVVCLRIESFEYNHK